MRRLIASLLSALAVVAACGLPSVGTGAALSDGGAAPAGSEAGADAPVTNADGGVVFLDSGLGSSSVDSGPVDPYTTRVGTNLVALYELEDKSGSTVSDSIAPAYPLQIATLADVQWHSHYLELKNFTRLAAGPNFTKLFTACAASDELTVEAWVRYASTQGGTDTYCRLITLAPSGGARDLALGNHSGKDYWFAMNNNEDALGGNPGTSLVHQVLVRSPENGGTIHGYVNGVEVATLSGTLAPQSMSAYPLSVGDSPDGSRAVTGDLHLIAFYSRALTATEVLQNFHAGADPAGP